METEVFVALVGVGGVIIGAAIPMLFQWRESQEKYKQLVFEKRLQVHQEAYSRCYKLWDGIKKDNYQIWNGFRMDFWHWIIDNSLYLDESSYRKLLVFIVDPLDFRKKYISALEISPAEANSIDLAFMKETIALQDVIAHGVGVDYIPKNRSLVQ